MSEDGLKTLYVYRMGIDTYKNPVIFLREDCEICKAEGFAAPSRVRVEIGNRFILATLQVVKPEIMPYGRVGFSEYAWEILSAKDGDIVRLSHPAPLESLSYLRGKIHGKKLTETQMQEIISDIANNLYSNIHIASFITACANGNLSREETLHLTRAMINTGKILTWEQHQIVDKHCIGGLPGNRTTMLVVPIVAAAGLTIPKTSSRAITSPAGTADTMEVLAPVKLNLAEMRKVVERENGCIVWGGAADLSPADDILIQVERALNLDNESQAIASVLSKKVSAGSTHVLIDIPVGPTAKVRSHEDAEHLKELFEDIAKRVGLIVKVLISNGSAPVGRGIGPALEARDVVAVLKNEEDAPQDLRERALDLAGAILEFSPKISKGDGRHRAQKILESGKAWKKFQAICKAQGGMRRIPHAKYKHLITASKSGMIIEIDNRTLASIAKLAGAPRSKAAGIELHATLNDVVAAGDALFTIHAESKGALEYAVRGVCFEHDIMKIKGNNGC
ncbi:MAG: thymidine phosphorylase family protein [Gammaproteobacteria bacterium]|nr:thymidine phosphorylase family protein [Gammaproteobacteria bacterium]